ncbi:MAG TPA: hypothetical protein VJT84_00580 [Gaiellaceae bacterium]|nr:hypothetical protein [Gaiellaceae bacterium]
MQEPGLDLHVWQSQWEALEPDLRDSPAEALPELGRLVDEMLAERGYDDPVEIDPEINRELEQARDVVRRLGAEEGVDPGDIAAAVNGYRAVFEELVGEHRAP